ncbi:O-antigen/teichoic acid export membrane protein [Bradyrhizobium sp. USDA 3397]
MKRELLANNVASAGSIFWRILVQLVIPPSLIAWWGADRYGEWLFITSLPLLLSVADLGFADAAASRMTMEVAKGNRDEASRIFQSIFALTGAICFALAASGSLLLLVGHLTIGKASFGEESLRAAFLFVCYSALLILSKLFLACLRAGRRYAESTLVYDALQALEGVGLLICAYTGRSFVFCSLVYVLMRLINIVALIGMIRGWMNWLRWGLELCSWETVRELLSPALAAMAMPVALALNFQGMIWIVGSSLGPTAAAVLSTVRTASRVIIQLVGIFSRAAMPIYSASVATNNARSLDIIQRVDRVLMLVLLFPGCAAFGLFGVQLVGLWTHGHIVPDASFVWIIAAGALFHGLWFFRTNLLVSINKHVKFGWALVGLTLAFTSLGIPSVKLFGMTGVATNLLALEFATFIAFWILNDHFKMARP